MTGLAQIQSDFQDYVLGQAGAQDVIAAQVRDQFGLRTPERLAIYRNAYRIRMREALSEAYGKTWTYVGDEMFAELADDYLAAHPSTFRNLRWYGGRFADFVAEALPDYPFIAELAAFECALGLAFDAQDAAALDRDYLQSVAPEAWGEQVFALHPAVQMLPMRWNVLAIWHALALDATPPDPELVDDEGHCLVWRSGHQPHFRALDAFEALALRRLGRGENFAQVCAAMAQDGMDVDVTRRMAQCLQNCLAHGLLSAPPA